MKEMPASEGLSFRQARLDQYLTGLFQLAKAEIIATHRGKACRDGFDAQLETDQVADHRLVLRGKRPIENVGIEQVPSARLGNARARALPRFHQAFASEQA